MSCLKIESDMIIRPDPEEAAQRRLVGGVAALWLFGTLIGTGARFNVFYGYLFAAALMIAAALIAVIYGITAERRSLEHVARPLSAEA